MVRNDAGVDARAAPRTGRGFRSNNGGRNRRNNGQFEIPINNRFQNFC